MTLCRIGNLCVVDPTPEEEACSSASLVMSVTPEGKVTAVKKRGPGTFNMDSLQRAILDGKETGIQLNTALAQKLQKEERMGSGRKIMGFLQQ